MHRGDLGLPRGGSRPDHQGVRQTRVAVPVPLRQLDCLQSYTRKHMFMSKSKRTNVNRYNTLFTYCCSRFYRQICT